MKKFIGLILILFSIATIGFAQTGIPRAQAMFIYNFSRLIEWPANYKTGEFVIGVLGNSPITSELESYTLNKKVGSQDIVVKTFRTTEEFTKCQILFVPFSKTKQLEEFSAKLSGQSTLVITEKNGAIDEGAGINFVIIGDKLKFEISSSYTTKYDVKFSSKLLEMAYKSY